MEAVVCFLSEDAGVFPRRVLAAREDGTAHRSVGFNRHRPAGFFVGCNLIVSAGIELYELPVRINHIAVGRKLLVHRIKFHEFLELDTGKNIPVFLVIPVRFPAAGV